MAHLRHAADGGRGGYGYRLSGGKESSECAPMGSAIESVARRLGATENAIRKQVGPNTGGAVHMERVGGISYSSNSFRRPAH